MCTVYNTLYHFIRSFAIAYLCHSLSHSCTHTHTLSFHWNIWLISNRHNASRVPYPLRIKCKMSECSTHTHLSLTGDVFILWIGKRWPELKQRKKKKKWKWKWRKCSRHIIHVNACNKYNEYIINYIANWGFIALAVLHLLGVLAFGVYSSSYIF